MSTGSGLATAFFRLYVLHALERGAARPAAILASLHAREGALPVQSGCFSRALQQLLDAGLVTAGAAGEVELTALGRRERDAQRPAWERLVAIVARLLAGDLPAPEPPDGGGVAIVARPAERVSDDYRDRVVLVEIRDAARRAREAGQPLGVALAEIAVAHPLPVRARAMLQRTLRETLGRAPSSFGPHARALRYGMNGVCLVVPGDGVETQAELLRSRLLESLGAMTATVRDFAGARYTVRAGAACMTREVVTSADLLRRAEDALAGEARRAAA